MNVLQSIGYGIVAFAILVVVGLVVLDKLGTATGGTANETATYIATQLGSGGLAGWIPSYNCCCSWSFVPKLLHG